jgi:hypothetical protein
MNEFLQILYSGFDEAAAEAQLADTERVVEGALVARAEADRVLQKAERERDAAQAALDAYHAWKATLNGHDTTVRRDDASHVIFQAKHHPNEQTPTGRRSILMAIEEGRDEREWTIPSIAAHFGLGPESHHAIGVSVSRLKRDGQIDRPRKGVYTKLAPKAVAAAEGAEREMELGERGLDQGG